MIKLSMIEKTCHGRGPKVASALLNLCRELAMTICWPLPHRSASRRVSCSFLLVWAGADLEADASSDFDAQVPLATSDKRFGLFTLDFLVDHQVFDALGYPKIV